MDLHKSGTNDFVPNRLGSLLPPMLIHWLSNVFQLNAYYQAAPASVFTIGGIYSFGLAALLSIVWVRFFVAKWLNEPPIINSVPA